MAEDKKNKMGSVLCGFCGRTLPNYGAMCGCGFPKKKSKDKKKCLN